MPRPRFEKLEANKKQAILVAAAEEFARHGFEAASYNNIIEASGLSKGAMYYYFDDKEDLYLTVLRDALLNLFTEIGDVPTAKNAAEFWDQFASLYRRCLDVFQAHPTALGLGRSLIKLTALGNSSALLEVRNLTRTWMEKLIHQGQAVKAIRRDLPEDLLLSVLMGLEEGIDIWLSEQLGDLSPPQMDSLVVTLTDLFRRVAAPRY